MSTSSKHRNVVLTCTRANLQDAIAGVLNGIVAHCLPARPSPASRVESTCDRTTSVVAQAAGLDDAISELIADLLDAIDLEQGGIGGVEIQGVMTGPDRCTIWGQACLDAPTPVTPLALDTLTVDYAPGAVSIVATLRPLG